VRVRFWGTRGSIATPGPQTVRYGGNTSCVEIRSEAGTLLVLDCGTGARLLGQALMAERAATGGSLEGSLLIGHTHWDHIQGLPFFAPLFDPDGRWQLYGPRGLGRSLAETLAGQMEYQYFPVSLDHLGGGVSYHDLVEGTFDVGDVSITAQYLNHPALTLGYRIEADGVSVVYAADHEPFDRELAGGGDLLAGRDDADHVAFLRDTDLVIHDAQYTAAEYPAKAGWGHSTMEYVVDAAALGGARRLLLYHHDPLRDDDAVDALVEQARARAAARGYRGEIDAAAEGAVVDLGRRAEPGVGGGARPGRAATTVPAVEEVAAAVVIAVADPTVAAAVRVAADAEDLATFGPAADGALDDLVRKAERAVVVVDADDAAIVERLRDAISSACDLRLAVVALTRRSVASIPSPNVTDWLVWPCTIAHLRTKLHSAVLRRACRWQAPPLPPDEDRRLRALHDLGLLDTEPEERFDRYTALACQALGVPAALITLVDAERQWFKSRPEGLPAETPRDHSICGHAILGSDILQVPDLLDDARFAENPAAEGPPRVRFYAGAPLTLSDGSRVGTLCVIDHRPRVLDDHQLEELRRLADLVQAELEAPAPVAARQ
jgi:phosphoribosyl 1,2-cyclic phosphodiesterase